MVNRPFKNTKYKGSGGIKVGSMENWIQTPEPYRDVRGLRHGPVPEAPQPLAHGPPGLHPAVGLRTSSAPARPSPHTARFQEFPPHWPWALGPRATLSASAPRAPGLVATRLRPARPRAPSEPPHPTGSRFPRRRAARAAALLRQAGKQGPGGSQAEPRA